MKEFNIGDRVRHNNKYAIITDKWCDENPIKRDREFRYTIQHSGWIWSVSGEELKAVKSRA